MIELYGDATGNTLRAVIALEEAELLHRYRRIDLSRGEQQSASYLRLNPTGRVPTIVVTNGATEPLVITQSNAIMIYIAEKSGRLLPAGMAARAQALEWLFFFVTDVIAPSHQSFFLRRSPVGNAHLEAAQLLDDRAASMFRYVEQHLTDRRYLAGDTFSLADIAGYTITNALYKRLPWDMLPKTSAWFDTLKSRPAVIRGTSAFQ